MKRKKPIKSRLVATKQIRLNRNNMLVRIYRRKNKYQTLVANIVSKTKK